MNPDITTIMQWNLQELYKYVLTLRDELTESELVSLTSCEQGDAALPVHINYFIKEYYEEYPSSHKAKIHGLGKVQIEHLWKELDRRETSLRNIIIAHLQEDKPTEGRV